MSPELAWQLSLLVIGFASGFVVHVYLTEWWILPIDRKMRRLEE